MLYSRKGDDPRTHVISDLVLWKGSPDMMTHGRSGNFFLSAAGTVLRAFSM